MGLLFERGRTTVNEHISHIFQEGELDKSLVRRKVGNPDFSDKPSYFYNLDVIISVGYRVKSKRGTQFRQWATKRLTDYLVKGKAINNERLKQLEQIVKIISDTKIDETISQKEIEGLLNILSNYTSSFILLNKFDSNSLGEDNLTSIIVYEIKYNEAKFAIEGLKKQLSITDEIGNLFGNEKDDSFKGILGNILQTFDGQYLYSSIEEQAANLLYLIIKNHPFSDGNKRIGAFLFVWFLEKNKYHLNKNNQVKINDNGLVALALLVAQSNPNDKELFIKLIINLINNK